MPSRYHWQLFIPASGLTSPMFEEPSFDQAELKAMAASIAAYEDGVLVETRIFVDGSLHHEHGVPHFFPSLDGAN